MISDEVTMLQMVMGEIHHIEYTNWKGKTRIRSIIPTGISYGATKYHPENQWLVCAVDCEDKQIKQFALKDMKLCLEFGV